VSDRSGPGREPGHRPPVCGGAESEANDRSCYSGALSMTVILAPSVDARSDDAPATARVFVDGRDVGTTPLTVTLARGRYRVAGARQAVHTPAAHDLTDSDRYVTLDFTVPETLRPDIASGTTNNVLGVWGSRATGVRAVGENGVILHRPDVP
jgi:hypothetical protein